MERDKNRDQHAGGQLRADDDEGVDMRLRNRTRCGVADVQRNFLPRAGHKTESNACRDATIVHRRLWEDLEVKAFGLHRRSKFSMNASGLPSLRDALAAIIFKTCWLPLPFMCWAAEAPFVIRNGDASWAGAGKQRDVARLPMDGIWHLRHILADGNNKFVLAVDIDNVAWWTLGYWQRETASWRPYLPCTSFSSEWNHVIPCEHNSAADFCCTGTEGWG